MASAGNIRTKEQALAALAKILKLDDVEEAHAQADDVLCKLLSALGYTDVVVQYAKVRKWYS